MTAVLTQAAAAVTAGGVLCGLVAVVATRTWRPGLHMALDFWVAAGLLRLTGEPTVADLLASAVIIAVRQLVAVGLRAGDRTLAGDRGDSSRRRVP